ncbi:hypothetical protein CSIRO_1697 [Bradyrhizobiaceae bacterium SG-6C]|nr:hypothetical protein CSIRO_1697 [Bradyrhizobiaceae bacterium SG-6C]
MTGFFGTHWISRFVRQAQGARAPKRKCPALQPGISLL